MQDIISAVEHFNRELVGIDRPSISPLSEQESDWMVGVLREEVDELEEAMGMAGDDSLVGQADALMDLIYFAIGGFTRLGISAAKIRLIFETVHSANMQKKAGKKEQREAQLDLDAVKPTGWVPPEEAIHHILFGRPDENS